MVAKSFQSMTQLTEPYAVGDKMYVDVKNEKTGTVRKVRWYTDKEYAKLYPGEKIPVSEDTIKVSQKNALGFQYGYITIFKGDIEANAEWFEKSIARFCRWWGWYIVSTDTIPMDLPTGIQPIELKWDAVGNDDGNLKSESQVTAAVNQLLYEPGVSEYVGKVGDRLDLHVTVTKCFVGDGSYGSYTVHTFEDANGNVYVWTTTSKSWNKGSVLHIRGTVKEHKTYKNVKQTILTRCMVVK